MNVNNQLNGIDQIVFCIKSKDIKCESDNTANKNFNKYIQDTIYKMKQ